MLCSRHPQSTSRGGLSRPASVAEGPRVAFERAKSIEEASRGGRGNDLERFQRDFGRSGELRSARFIGRGGARSTFNKIQLFRFGDRFGIDFAPPEASLGSSLALPGALWGAWVALGAALVGSMGALGASSGVSWNGLGRSGRLLGTPKAPRALRGLIWE